MTGCGDTMMTSLGVGVSITEPGPVDHAPVFLGAAAHDQTDPKQCEWCPGPRVTRWAAVEPSKPWGLSDKRTGKRQTFGANDKGTRLAALWL